MSVVHTHTHTRTHKRYTHARNAYIHACVPIRTDTCLRTGHGLNSACSQPWIVSRHHAVCVCVCAQVPSLRVPDAAVLHMLRLHGHSSDAYCRAQCGGVIHALQVRTITHTPTHTHNTRPTQGTHWRARMRGCSSHSMHHELVKLGLTLVTRHLCVYVFVRVCVCVQSVVRVRRLLHLRAQHAPLVALAVLD